MSLAACRVEYYQEIKRWRLIRTSLGRPVTWEPTIRVETYEGFEREQLCLLGRNLEGQLFTRLPLLPLLLELRLLRAELARQPLLELLPLLGRPDQALGLLLGLVQRPLQQAEHSPTPFLRLNRRVLVEFALLDRELFGRGTGGEDGRGRGGVRRREGGIGVDEGRRGQDGSRRFDDDGCVHHRPRCRAADISYLCAYGSVGMDGRTP